MGSAVTDTKRMKMYKKSYSNIVGYFTYSYRNPQQTNFNEILLRKRGLSGT